MAQQQTSRPSAPKPAPQPAQDTQQAKPIFTDFASI